MATIIVLKLIKTAPMAGPKTNPDHPQIHLSSQNLMLDWDFPCSALRKE